MCQVLRQLRKNCTTQTEARPAFLWPGSHLAPMEAVQLEATMLRR